MYVYESSVFRDVVSSPCLSLFSFEIHYLEKSSACIWLWAWFGGEGKVELLVLNPYTPRATGTGNILNPVEIIILDCISVYT